MSAAGQQAGDMGALEPAPAPGPESAGGAPAVASGSTDQDSEEMAAAERDLAEDAQWKRIQQNTFTRWANEHLKTVSKHIGNLETDLSDGLRLITLIEVLSGKKLPKYNKRPTFRSQKLENVSVALQFLERGEGIRIVNIDSSDIVDCKLKLILGLIWTLILHYSISLPMWEGEEDYPPGDKQPTPKQRLLHWIQSKIPDLPITNFTSDWNDGRAVGALVDAVAPGLCPDWQDWDPKDAIQNAAEAIGLADDWLNVRQLITPEEMVNPKMDEMSMMTYLSQYPSAKLKPGAPLRPRTNPNRVSLVSPSSPEVPAEATEAGGNVASPQAAASPVASPQAVGNVTSPRAAASPTASPQAAASPVASPRAAESPVASPKARPRARPLTSNRRARPIITVAYLFMIWSLFFDLVV